MKARIGAVLIALVLGIGVASAQDYYPAYGVFTRAMAVTIPGLVTTSTDGAALTNPTPATVGVPVQLSPRVKMCGTAWNSVGAASEADCFFLEALPVSAAGTTSAVLRIGYINPAGAISYPATFNSGAAGLTLAGGNVTASGFDGAVYGFNQATRSRLLSSADKLLSVTDSTQTTGLEVNNGSATLGTCTGGTITAGSHNFGGGYTGNTSGSCIVNFGAPAWTNAPFCGAWSTASTTHPRVSAISTTSMTITGGVSGEAITYLCSGRIGT